MTKKMNCTFCAILGIFLNAACEKSEHGIDTEIDDGSVENEARVEEGIVEECPFEELTHDRADNNGEVTSPDFTLPDVDPNHFFTLVVPPETQLCTTFYEGRTWDKEFRMRGLVQLKAGVYLLPKEKTTIPFDWIEMIQVGIDKRVAEPEGEGQIEATYPALTQGPNQSPDDSWDYLFGQTYNLNQEPYRLEIQLFIPTASSVVTLNREFASQCIFVYKSFLQQRNRLYGKGFIGYGEDPVTEIHDYVACDIDYDVGGAERSLSTITAQGDQGSEITIDMTECGVSVYTHTTFVYRPTKAIVMHTEQQYTVLDPIDLAYASTHHNTTEWLVVELPESASSSRVMVLECPSIMAGPGAIIWLDQELKEIDRESVVQSSGCLETGN